MEPFISNHKSHDHSRYVLDLIYQYDSFLDSITTVCDMGCGAGLDALWWGTLQTREDPPEPRNLRVVALDKDISRLDPELKKHENISILEKDFEELSLPLKVDVIWSHDSFQYALRPMETLALWNRQMSDNGMLILSVPEYSGNLNGRIVNRSYNNAFYNYNIVNLIHMLAMSGFDCQDAYFYRKDNWLYAGVYKTRDPFDFRKTKLYDLVDAGMFHKSAADSITRYGYIRQEDLIYPWLDKDFYQYK
jgi:SAM-dependent methyltransferase